MSWSRVQTGYLKLQILLPLSSMCYLQCFALISLLALSLYKECVYLDFRPEKFNKELESLALE